MKFTIFKVSRTSIFFPRTNVDISIKKLGYVRLILAKSSFLMGDIIIGINIPPIHAISFLKNF